MRAQNRRNLTGLPQIEALERLVGQKHRLRGHQADRQQHTLALTFRKSAERLMQQSGQVEAVDSFFPHFTAASEKANREVEHPTNGLRRPWRNTVRKIEK